MTTQRNPLNTALAAWADRMRSDSYSPATIHARTVTVAKLCRTQHITDGHVTEAHVRAYLDERNYKPASVLAKLSHLKKWAAFLGIDDPTTNIRRPARPEFVPRPIPEHHLHQLLAHAHPMMAAWIKLGAYAGLRASEVALLHAHQLNTDPTSGTRLYLTGKGGRVDSVPIAAHVAESLAPFITGPGRLWAVVPDYLSVLFRDFTHTQGLDYGFHQNRHRFGTQVYRHTRDLLITQRLMRHSSPQQTTAYVRISDDTQPIVELLPFPGQGPTGPTHYGPAA